MIPLMKAECVGRYGWMSDAEFLETLALGNTLPGPIAVKMAVAIGGHAGGVLGALVALVGLCLPGVALMVLLAAIFNRFRELPWVMGMLRGAKAGVVGLLVYTAYELAPDGVKDWKTGLIAVVSLVGLVAKVHPALLMAGALAVGALWR